ncbi:hypothetical protein CHLRE_04g226114v5 [Chlamydomonas reinhardtii]|uniref:Uncharacterized protein n=1 Tax=Chlamydomonas reinhardtii TaxID=3055 RepID=A0A2K3DUM5_CHLRE|nr:uncharacterized protein CHLRE_04g226114v5 [Chlamydomonas reinhardtii]PNW84229.1 hypothetical protein CHLRE_04g226114v5 [Chlamydomonas reinhardtii]
MGEGGEWMGDTHKGAEAGATPVTATVGFGGIDRTGPRWLALRSLAASLQGFVAATGAGQVYSASVLQRLHAVQVLDSQGPVG